MSNWLRYAALVLLLRPPVVAAQVPTAGTVAAGLVPGQRMRVTTKIALGDSTAPEPEHQLDGLLVDIDSASVTLRLDDGNTRRVVRTRVETLQLYRGRSRWRGLLAGWLVAIPVAAFVCRDHTYECDEGGVVGLVGGITGAIVGWPEWEDVRFP